jgi:hypothetical protein
MIDESNGSNLSPGQKLTSSFSFQYRTIASQQKG